MDSKKEEKNERARVLEHLAADPEMKEALGLFMKEHGRNWRNKLSRFWEESEDEYLPGLRRARNKLGPFGIYAMCDVDLEDK